MAKNAQPKSPARKRTVRKDSSSRLGGTRRTRAAQSVPAALEPDAAAADAADPADFAEPAETPAALARTLIHRTLPVRVRSRLDQAILHRPPNCATLEAIAAKFELADRYQISMDALRTYANRLEQCLRPAVTSQLMAGVLGCLPEQYRRQLIAGSQILLLSRIMQALGSDSDTALPVSDLVKLAGALNALGRRTAARQSRLLSRKKSEQLASEGSDTPPTTQEQPTKLAEAVRMIYGLNWPPEKGEPTSRT